MIKLSTEDNIIEYRYTRTNNCEGICEDMGWHKTTGEAKQKQIMAIEDAFEYEHPINPKTHKPKTSWIFWKQLKEVELIDNRKNNGGKYYFPEEEFDYLLNCILFTGWNKNDYRQSNKTTDTNANIKNNEIYLSNGLIYSEFGFPVYKYLNKIETDIGEEAKTYAWKKFKEICVDAVKSNTITRICNKYGFNKNNIPKGILRKQNKNSDVLVPDDNRLNEYDERWSSIMKLHKCYNWSDVFSEDKYREIDYDVKKEFEKKEGIYGIKKYNKLTYSYDEYKEFANKFNISKKELYQYHFRKAVLVSIEKSVYNRITGAKNYKIELSDEQKNKMSLYLELLKNSIASYN